MIGYSWLTRPGLTGMMQATLVAVLATAAIQAVAFRRNWKGQRIAIGRSKGRRVLLRLALVVLAFYGLSTVLWPVLDRFLDWIATGQEMKIGIGNALMFFWIVSLHAVIVLQLVRAVEIRDGWHRLAGVHPKALAELQRLQASVHAHPGT